MIQLYSDLRPRCDLGVRKYESQNPFSLLPTQTCSLQRFLIFTKDLTYVINKILPYNNSPDKTFGQKFTFVYFMHTRQTECLWQRLISINVSDRECVSTGAAGARRSLGHHLLHPLILRLLVLCAPADFQAQSSLLQNGMHQQIQIPNACPAL